MKKENFTLDFNTPLKRIARLSILPVLLIMLSFQAQAQDCPLGCNNSVQISLNNSGNVTVTPDMILEGQGDASCNYTVEVLDANDNIIPNAFVDCDYVGQTLKVRVILDGSNSCWGTITLEDKLKPVLTCADLVEISCYQTFNPGLPAVSDNCDSNPVIAVLSDVTTDIDCADPDFPTLSAQRVITYRATDASGNVSDICTQTVNYLRIGLDQITFPDNLDDVEDDALPCGSYSEDKWDESNPAYPFFNVTGAPTTPDGSPILPNNSLCELNATFSDQIITICESSFKVLRTFTVLDWCTGDVREEFQIIKIVDNDPPLVTAIPDDEYAAFADPYTCTASFAVPAPTVIFDCSSWTYEIGYALAVNGMAPTDGIYFTTNVSGNGTTGYTISDLPLGQSWLRYTITDGCGNVTEAFTEITVVDNIPPIAVCDEFTVVTLTSDGSAYAFAATFDDGSFDNCSPVTLSVRRPDGGCGAGSAFGDYVEFCCSDVGNDVMVELRVTEDSANALTNSCMVTVHVQDKIDPVITCPADVTIDCTEDYTDSSHGEPTGFDNCSGTITGPFYSGSLNDCGSGVITKSWTITDGGGRTDNCSQRITVENMNVFNGNNSSMLSFPNDVTLQGCMNENTDESQTGVPTINAGICSLVAYTSSDKVFNFQDGACFKILRTFTVIDWCTYDTNDNSTNPPGIWQHTQVIKLNNSIAPTFNGCTATVDAPVVGANCNGFVTLTASASDDCPNVTEDELVFSYQFDQFNDGSINQSGSGNDASRTLSVGQHRIIWTVEDRCGNINTCEQVINVRDAKKPTPYCLSDITTVVMPTTGMIAIWASDFNLGSTDNCTDSEDLVYTFGVLQTNGTVSNTGSGNMTFDCDDTGMNTVYIMVTDEAGNTDYCETTINIQANEGCEGSRIAGAISTEMSSDVDQVEVMLEDMNSQEERYFMTDASGNYQFFNIASNVDYEISATRNDNPTNGVSTLDLVLIQRHILGFTNLDSPYKIIAADVNGSENVSAADITELRKVILGVQPAFNQSNSWRFIDGAQTFFEVTEPWPLQEKISVNNIENAMNNNFIAIKIGDVNGTATSNLSETVETEVRSSNTTLNVTNEIYKAGEEVRMDIRSDDFKAIAGLQFTLNFDDNALEYVGVEAAKLNINDSNVGVQLANRGEITASWNATTDITATSNEVLMTVIFRAKTNGDLSSMTMSADQLISEAYTTELNITGLDIEVRDANATFAEADIVLQQNRPNPFTNTTQVSFTLVEAGTATLSIYDINGRLVNRVNDTYSKGINSIIVNADELNVSGGIFYYTLEANGQIATKKMILLSK